VSFFENLVEKGVTKTGMGVQTDVESEMGLIRGLMEGNANSIGYLYKHNLPAIRKMVFQFDHIVLEPEDVIQEGLTRAIINIRSGKFKGNSSIHTYLYSICRNICLKEARNQSKEIRGTRLNDDIAEENTDHEDDTFELIKLVVEIKNGLEERCREIIDLRFDTGQGAENRDDRNRFRFESIAEKLGITPDNARQRFKRCLEKLINAVKGSKYYHAMMM